MRRLASVLRVGVIVGLVAACSSSGSRGPAADDPTLRAAAAACADLARSVCARTSSCEPLSIATHWGDVATCEARSELACASMLAANGTSLTATKVEACAIAVRTMDCDDLAIRLPPSACRSTGGALADGAPCATADQCASGHCAVRHDGSSFGSAIFESQWSPQCDVCGSFQPVQEADGCHDCPYGTTCRNQAGLNRCVGYGGAGAACGPAYPCLPSLVCSQQVCAAPLLAVGAPCDPAEDLCESGVVCDWSSKVCESVLLVSVGQSCGYPRTCTGGATCSLRQGNAVCIAAAGDGEPCDETNRSFCRAPASCVNGVCAAPNLNACK